MHVQANTMDFYWILVELERKSHFNSNLIKNTHQEGAYTAGKYVNVRK